MNYRQRRKVVVYRTDGKLDYFKYYYNGVWKNEKQCEAWLKKHPGYEPSSTQVIKSSRKARRMEFYRYRDTEPMTVSQIVEYCADKKKDEKESRPVVLKEEKEYLYNKEHAEEWVALAEKNGWDLNESIKPLCEHLGLAPVVIAPVLQRYKFIEKRKAVEKVYKISKQQAQGWWDIKTQEGLSIKQVGERVGVHFLQVGRAFTHYGFVPKKIKLSREEKKELRKQKKLLKNK